MEVINFKCIRIQTELDRYQRSKTIPHDLLEGSFSMDDIEECMEHMSKKHARLAKKLIKQYKSNIENSLVECKKALRVDYSAAIKSLATVDGDFKFPTILIGYRVDINPITALYYETREMVRKFNPENPKHEWLYGLVTDSEFNNKVLSALAKDMKRLERIISRYYWPLSKLDDNIPLEIFHARQLTKDFKHYYTFFSQVKNWQPDE